MSGGSVEQLEGARVTFKCPGENKLGWEGDKGAYREFLFSVKAGPRGARLTSFWVDYTSDGKDYTVEVPWETVMCGTETPAEMC